MMFPILQIGPLAIQVPGLIILAGLWLGLSLAERRAKKRESNPSVLYNLVFVQFSLRRDHFRGNRSSFSLCSQLPGCLCSKPI
jgi:hypothetical protein